MMVFKQNTSHEVLVKDGGATNIVRHRHQQFHRPLPGAAS